MKASTKIISFCLAASVLCSTSLTAHAAARKEGQETGRVGQFSLEQEMQSQKKLNAVMRICEIQEKYLRQGCSISQQERQELEQLLSEYYPNAAISAYLPDPGMQTASLRESADPNGAVIPSVVNAFPRVYLNLPGKLQEKGHYCGPASGYAVLKGLGIAVTQSELAKKMGTTTDGTGLEAVEPALNSYSGRNGKKFKYATLKGYQLTGKKMTAAQWEKEFVNAAVTTTAGGYGVIYDVHQVAGSKNFLQGYDNKGRARSEIFHYVAGEGWDKKTYPTLHCLYYDSNRLDLGTHHMHVTFSTMAVLCNDRGVIY